MVDRKDATGREAMSLLADSLELNDDPIVQRFVRAVRSAESAPKSDGNRAYNVEFLVWMGLAQSEPGRPPKPFPVDDLKRFLLRNPDVTNNSLKKAMNAVDDGISETRALSYIVRARERIAGGAERLKAVRASPAFANGEKKMAAIVAANGLAPDMDLVDLNR